jgi:hypothetical protein
MLRSAVNRPISLGVKHTSEVLEKIFISVRQLRVCWLGRLLWRDDGSVVYISCWPSPAELTHCSNCPAYISARTAEKTSFFCCCILLLPWKHVSLRSRYSGNALVLLISRSLFSNGSPFLRLFVPNGLQAHQRFFFPWGCVCEVCDRPRLHFSWLGSHGEYPPTVPAAPYSRLLVLSGSLMRCEPVRVYMPLYYNHDSKRLDTKSQIISTTARQNLNFVHDLYATMLYTG